jgi:Ca2+-binding EF-hand superfamily protein
MKKAKYVTFDAGSIIMKEGMPGRTFYVIDSGEVEISVRGAFEDPLTTPKGYLGAVVNRLRKKNYFGERSLITGQPRAASIKATEKTRCFTFDVDDIPDSSVLSGKRGATTERLQEVDDKYAVDYYNIDMISSQFKEANVMSQVRGSPNTPVKIKGVDYEEEDNDDTFSLDLLLRFKLLRHAARCFEYILKTNPTWGNEGESYRRSMLVSKLTPAQRFEFTDVFKLIDTSRDGTISMLELKRALETIDDEKIHTDDELLEMINKADPTVDGNTEISFDEFMGVMAEAEFYYLFKETFASLDKENSGYVQAGKLNKILRGLRDLISDDRKSIIDMDDKDMLIDYETFSRMMIGNI